MVQEEPVPPDPQLMESMRSVGYTVEASIADVIDNSITAGAGNVWIDVSASGEPNIAITDDGSGMSAEEAVNAMRMGAINPKSVRSPTDLGRFGLGLKTASLAQCRTLTVASRKSGAIVGYRWSLDHLAETREWSLLKLDERELQQLPGIGRLTALLHGTLVLWQDLDQLMGRVGHEQRAVDEAMISVRSHLALVFHRFISGDGGPPVKLLLNGTVVTGVDPFLSNHRSTQRGPIERFTIQGETITVQPFTLPYITKLSREDRERAQVAGTLRDSQGFYIYRARRLVIWGTWFLLISRTELGKLARVKVDIPNSLDHLWSLDIKKSTASPPPGVRSQLRRLTETTIQPSRRAHTYRGRRSPDEDPIVRTWHVVADRESFRYEINRDHPIIAALAEGLGNAESGSLDLALRLIESTFPVQDVQNRLEQDAIHLPANADETAALDEARALWEIFVLNGQDIEAFVTRFKRIEPFNMISGLEEKLRKAVDHDR